MKAISCIPLLFASVAWADQPADRAAIERVINAWNDGQTGSGEKQNSTLLTPDANKELARMSGLQRLLIEPCNRPWSEETPPRLAIQSVRFVTPDVALVDAANTQYGTMILVRRIPILLVMKKEGAAWRIAAFRMPVDLMGF